MHNVAVQWRHFFNRKNHKCMNNVFIFVAIITCKWNKKKKKWQWPMCMLHHYTQKTSEDEMFNTEHYISISMLKNIIRAIAIKSFYCHYIIFHKTVITNNTIAAIHVFPIPCNLGLMEARLIRMASSVRMVRLPWLGQVFK